MGFETKIRTYLAWLLIADQDISLACAGRALGYIATVKNENFQAGVCERQRGRSANNPSTDDNHIGVLRHGGKTIPS